MIIVGHKDGSVNRILASSINQVTKDMLTHTIIGGEFALASDDENVAFKTLLGSCVAIMFYDKVKKIKAMNHFLLPKLSSETDNMKYGLFSVELMLNEMYKLGCQKANMEVKISGGADIMNFNSKNSIGLRNVQFAKQFCQSEGFRIISEHCRGEHGRLILLANDFKTFIKVTDKSQTDNKILSDETRLQTEIAKAPVIKEYVGGVDLFDNDKKVEPEMEIELF